MKNVLYKKIFIFLIALLIVIIGIIFLKKVNWNKSKLIEIENENQVVHEPESKQEIYPDSLPFLMKKNFSGSDLKLGKVLDKNEFYTRYYITYKSEGFLISGIMNVPEGTGPFPVLIFNHGFIEPSVYTNGQGLKREQDYFARRGYVVIHPDYRNHADSDFDPENDTRPRTGYTEDVINAIVALKNSSFSFLDKKRIGMLGHSMGGGVSLNVMVTKPDLVKAYVLLAPINADYKENFDRWVAPEMQDIAKRTLEKYGTFEDNPDFWKTVSAENYFSNIKSPIMLHQGTLDEDVPVEWSRELVKNLERENKDVQYFEYPGESHIFIAAQSIVMKRSLDFFDTYLKQ